LSGFDPKKRMNPILAAASWVPAALTLVGIIIGAAASIAGGAFSQWFTWQKERQSIASALAAEVRVFIEVVNWRDTRELIPKGHVFPIEDHPFPVFEANVGKIGYLPADLAGKVTEFYSYGRGVAQDFRTLWKKEPIENVSEFRNRLVEGLDTLKMKSDALVPELLKEAARDWKQVLQP
jgi:hypothetical protein